MSKTVKSTIVFAVLVGVTLLSSLGVETSGFSHRGAAILIIGAAIIKTLLVIYFFMGVKNAHVIVRVLVFLWAIGIGGVLIFYA